MVRVLLLNPVSFATEKSAAPAVMAIPEGTRRGLCPRKAKGCRQDGDHQRWAKPQYLLTELVGGEVLLWGTAEYVAPHPSAFPCRA